MSKLPLRPLFFIVITCTEHGWVLPNEDPSVGYSLMYLFSFYTDDTGVPCVEYCRRNYLKKTLIMVQGTVIAPKSDLWRLFFSNFSTWLWHLIKTITVRVQTYCQKKATAIAESFVLIISLVIIQMLYRKQSSFW